MTQRIAKPTLTAATMLALAGTAIAEPSFSGVGDLPGGMAFSQARAVAANGDAVAAYSETTGAREAARWRPEIGLESIGGLRAAAFSDARGMSADGSVIVGESMSQAFMWRDSVGMIGLGYMTKGQSFSRAQGVSDDGAVVVGMGQSLKGVEAFVYTESDGMVGIGDLPGWAFSSTANGVSPDGGTVVGHGFSYDGFQAFSWTADGGMVGLGDLDGGGFASAANDTSEGGHTVVGRGLSASGNEAFMYTSADGMVGLGDLPLGRFFSQANAVSGNGGVIVGYGYDASGKQAVMWRGNGPERVVDVLANDFGFDMSDWRLQEALDVSGDGQVIVGIGINPGGWAEGWVADMRVASALECPEDTLVSIWPPNGKMREIDLADVIEMPEGSPADVAFEITGITQDEPVANGNSRHVQHDGAGVGTGLAEIRAERAGWGNGRVYKIHYTATSGSASCDSVVTVHVGHDKKTPCVDDGQNFDSTLLAPPGDIDGDGVATADDLSILFANWNESRPFPGDPVVTSDLNADGRVNMLDVKILLSAISDQKKDQQATLLAEKTQKSNDIKDAAKARSANIRRAAKNRGATRSGGANQIGDNRRARR